MKQLVRNVKIIGTGSYTPERILTNLELESMVDTNSEWIEKNLGINGYGAATLTYPTQIKTSGSFYWTL